MTETVRMRRIDEIAAETRRRILDAAEELFAERGLDRTSIVDIAALARISRGSVTGHFTNKDGLMRAVLERSIRRAVSVERYADWIEPPPLALVLTDYVAYLHRTNPRLLLMVLSAASDPTSSVHAFYREFMSAERINLTAWFRAQRPAGVDGVEATEREEATATAIIAALMGLTIQWQLDPDVPVEQSLAALARLVDGNVQRVYDGMSRGQ